MEQLRENLALFPWEPDHLGVEQWVLHDPLQNKFFYLDAGANEMLRAVAAMDLSTLTARVKEPLSAASDELDGFIKFLKSNDLIRSMVPEAEEPKTASKKKHSGLLRWIELYISFTVPLLSPDRFLSRTLPYVRGLYTKRFVYLSFCFGLLGLIMATRDVQGIIDQAQRTFSFSNIQIFIFAVILTKLVHEFSHAYVAKLHGAYVPTMGLKFIVLVPLPYTDTSDTWRIYSHNARRDVAIAGVTSELVFASWTTLLWNFAPNDGLSEFLFIIASSTWISSVAINAVPFMRFDGYFVLMDLLRAPNLHARAGAMGKWFLREMFLGLGREQPEVCTPQRRLFYIIFSYITWIYRFTVFLTIALVVYHFFIKILGMIMFLVECWYFILRPVVIELVEWWKMRTFFKLRFRNLVILSLTAMALFLTLYPFQKTYSVYGMLTQGSRLPIYATESGRIVEIGPRTGDSLNKGDIIYRLENAEIENDLRQATIALEAASLLFGNSSFADTSDNAVQRLEVLADEQNTLTEAFRRSSETSLTATQSADRIEFTRDYAIGDLISRGELVAWSYAGTDWAVTCDLPLDLREIEEGTLVTIYPLSNPLRRIDGEIEQRASVPSQNVTNWELGEVLVSELDLQSSASQPTYQIPHIPAKVTLNDIEELYQGPVRILIAGQRESLLFGLYRKAYNILVRELEF